MELTHGIFIYMHRCKDCNTIMSNLLTAYGISKTYNQHSEEHPWYGAGQGTGDAASRWVVQSNSLINAYHAEACIWQLPDPIST